MTEYDYSPDAYKRYLATQQRIARWAENTSRYRPSNPFVASPTSGDSSQNSSFYKDSSRSSDSNHSKIRHRSTSSVKTITPNVDGPTYVKRSNTQSILVPIDGGGYVIIPPKGTRLEVMVSACLLLLSILAWWATSDVVIYVT
ncbi:hypothetical protein AN958_04335 [Leucoagaricus sp. SymC.cos]|nr:hypothetical protein AN958_04335 [Leucoagaricus sp. SymC.cos]